MSKYFFGRPMEAQFKDDYLARRESEERALDERIEQIKTNYQKDVEDINKKYRKQLIADIISDTMSYLPELEEEDIDKICNNLKTLKKNL